MEGLGELAKFQKMMVSNGVGGIFVGWGMSIDSKRAKECQNRTPDELVMTKTKFQPSQCQG